MEPIVIRERRVHHFGIPDLGERNPGVLQRHRDGIVPRCGVRRRVDGDLRRLLERHGVHVVRFDLTAHGRHRAVDRFAADAIERRIPP
jgi:hypothetical protein